jgi:nucleoside triphosphate diphosphatase
MSETDSAAAAREFARLVTVMATLRGPEGCPWDREQTIDSLTPFVLEETYEVLDAIDRHDHDSLREELGDFLFEAVFLAQLEAEAGRFTIADSIKSIADKLVRRHPHVFDREEGAPLPDSAGTVRVRWEEIKAQERAETGGDGAARSLLSGIAPTLPALLRAFHIGTRAASVGFDWARSEDVVAKIEEEIAELREVVDGNPVQAEEEMGDLLFAIASLSRKLGIEPETALRKANDKFTRRFTAMEQRLAADGQSMSALSLEALDAEWRRVKEEAPRTSSPNSGNHPFGKSPRHRDRF